MQLTRWIRWGRRTWENEKTANETKHGAESKGESEENSLETTREDFEQMRAVYKKNIILERMLVKVVQTYTLRAIVWLKTVHFADMSLNFS